MCHRSVTVGKPAPYDLPREPRTWGEHLRRQRILRGLLQREVADKIGVDVFTVLNWERGKRAPKVRHLPKLIAFLGYCLWEPARHPGDVLRQAREAMGLSHVEAAKYLRVDQATVSRWESGQRRLPASLVTWLGEPGTRMPVVRRSAREDR
jgi:transcriptional regulator with XRE-family HTH domain